MTLHGKIVPIDDTSLPENIRKEFFSQLESFLSFLPNTLKKLLLSHITAHFLPESALRGKTGALTAEEMSHPAQTGAGADSSLRFLAGQGAYRLAITRQGAAMVAMAFGVELRDGYLFCMANGIWPLRFIRSAGSLTIQEQEYLLRSRVAIVGCGALGGYASMLLARIGIGSLVLCDDDCFEESNLNRQLFCVETALGRPKVEVAQEKLLEVASHLLVTVFQERATPDSLPHMLSGSLALVDCVDSIATRLVLETAASQQGIPYIHGAVAGFEGFAGISFVHNASSGLMQGLYGSEESLTNDKSVIAEAGLFAATPAAIGTLQAVMTVQTLLSAFAGKDIPVRKLVYLDLHLPALDILSL